MEELLTRKEATKFLGLSENTLNHLACKKNNDLPFIKMNHKSNLIYSKNKYIAMYRLSDLEAYKKKLTISEELLTRKEATKFLGVKFNTLNRLATKKNNDLPYIKVNGVSMYRLSDLEAYKKKLTMYRLSHLEAYKEKHNINEELLTRKEAAKFLGITTDRLKNLFWKKNNDLPFIKMHHKGVSCPEGIYPKNSYLTMYRLSDLEAYKEKP